MSEDNVCATRAQDPHELAIERVIDAPPEIVWRVWFGRLNEWFCPPPWRAEIVEHDLRPGGRAAVMMYGPNGEEVLNDGVFLEIVPNRRIVVTDAFSAGWRPQGPFMVGFWEFTPQDGKTHLRAGAWHWTAEAKAQHEAMGFTDGWTIVAGQLAALAEAEAGRR